MDGELNAQTLATMGAGVVVLGIGGYALPVRFRVRGTAVEVRVPAWTGVDDIVGTTGDVTLVAVSEQGQEHYLRWLFVRGPAAVVPDPDWEGLEPAPANWVSANDLYRLLRIKPVRMELVDEARGWGFRETVDL
jgi:hypothetical protein